MKEFMILIMIKSIRFRNGKDVDIIEADNIKWC